MTDDKIVKDTARDPEREALGRLRGGIRAAAKKAVRKVAKKASQKKAVKKATTTAARTTARGAKSAKRGDKSAPGGVGAPSSRAAAARTTPAKTRAAPAGAAKDASPAARVSEAAPRHENGPPIETPRPPPAPLHPGAVLDTMQEHGGGLGSMLALWGPLIIVGFLVLVFRGADEGESTATAGADVPARTATDATAGMAPGRRAGGAVDPTTGGIAPARASAPPGVAPGTAEAFDGGFAVRASIAGPPVFSGREPLAGMPAVAPRRLYPSPSGPYRDPRYRSLPTGESWSADSAGEWMWSAEGRAGPGQEDGGDAPVQWVRCAAPFYWCPAPSSPAW